MAEVSNQFIIAELSGWIGSEDIEFLLDEPLAEYDVSYLVKMGIAFKEIGERLTNMAREEAIRQNYGLNGKEVIKGIEYQYQKGSTFPRVDTKYISAKYPKEEHPDFWTTGSRKETVKMSVVKVRE